MPQLNLTAKLALNKQGFDSGLKGAVTDVKRFGETAKAAAGSFAAVMGVAFVKHIADVTGRIKDLSEQWSITTDEVQKADYALKQSGLQFEDLGSAMARIASTRRDAVEGNLELRETFARLGLSVKDLNDPQLRNYDILQKLAQATANHNLSAREQSELMDLIGPKAAKLVNVLSNLATTNPITIISQEEVERIDKASKDLENLKMAAEGLAAPAVANGAGRLTRFIQKLNPNSQDFSPASAARDVLSNIFPVQGFIADKLIPDEVSKRQQNREDYTAAAQKATDITTWLAGLFVSKPSGLWDVDSKLKATASSKGDRVEPDQFGRIGAFTGASARAAKDESIKAMHSTLEKLNDNVKSGIVIKGGLE